MRNIFRKISLVLLIAIIIGGGFWFFKNYIYHTPTVLPEEELMEIEELEKNISTPGPLALSQTEEGIDSLKIEKIIYFTNFYRQKERVKKLKENKVLSQAAEQKLNDMFEKQYFGHISPEGTGAGDIIESLDYQYLRVGENLALGNFKSEKELVDGWMGSPGHRENILNSKFEEIGVATKKDIFEGKETFLAVQIFATSLSKCLLPDKSLLSGIEAKEIELKKIQNKAEDLEAEIEKLQEENENLYREGQDLISEGENLIKKGNELIKEGNRIYKQTGNKEEAEKYWQEGNDLQKEGQEKIDAGLALNENIEENNTQIQTKVQEYNNLISEIDNLSREIQGLISNYNSQVLRFNQCVVQ